MKSPQNINFKGRNEKMHYHFYPRIFKILQEENISLVCCAMISNLSHKFIPSLLTQQNLFNCIKFIVSQLERRNHLDEIKSLNLNGFSVSNHINLANNQNEPFISKVPQRENVPTKDNSLKEIKTNGNYISLYNLQTEVDSDSLKEYFHKAEMIESVVWIKVFRVEREKTAQILFVSNDVAKKALQFVENRRHKGVKLEGKLSCTDPSPSSPPENVFMHHKLCSLKGTFSDDAEMISFLLRDVKESDCRMDLPAETQNLISKVNSVLNEKIGELRSESFSQRMKGKVLERHDFEEIHFHIKNNEVKKLIIEAIEEIL